MNNVKDIELSEIKPFLVLHQTQESQETNYKSIVNDSITSNKDNETQDQRTKIIQYIKLLVIFFVFSLIVYWIMQLHEYPSCNIIKFTSNQRVYIKENHSNQYIRINDNITSSDHVILTHDIPFIYSSLLSLHISPSNECFQLQSLNGLWLKWDKLSSRIILINEGLPSMFAAINVQSLNGYSIKLKLCRESIWIDTEIMSHNNSSDSDNDNRTEYLLTGRYITSHDIDKIASFDIIPQKQIRGVNLGGWFIPEVNIKQH